MCSSLNDVLEIFRDKYFNEIRDYLNKIKVEEASKQFESHYAARAVVEQMMRLVEADNSARAISMLAALHYIHGSVSMDVEENHEADLSLNKALKLIENDPVSCDNILTLVSTYNQLGLLWCERGDFEKALQYLKQAEEFYDKYSEEGVTDLEMLLTGVTSSESGKVALEKLHTLTSYYLAQALGSLGQSVSAAAYCHRTLQRQLASLDLDKGDWALNAATLSQVLVENNAYKEAKNHLVAASYLLKQLQIDIDSEKEHMDQQVYTNKCEVIEEREAEVCRCWIKYCVNLLAVSRDRLLDDTAISTPKELVNLEFEVSKLRPESETETYDITCGYVLTWEDAVCVFRFATKCIEISSKYYTLDSHASDHVSIVKDHSQLNMYLAFFTDDISKQCKIHKKRLDMLRKLTEELNQQYYVDLLRQLWFEMGETCIVLIDLKTHQMQSCRGAESGDYVSKINNLVKQGVQTFQKFLDSFKDLKGGGRYEEVYERSILLSKIHQAQLLIKIKSEETSQVVQYNTIAYTNYKEIVDYVDKVKSEALTEGEIKACREMAQLLPLKLTKLLN